MTHRVITAVLCGALFLLALHGIVLRRDIDLLRAETSMLRLPAASILSQPGHCNLTHPPRCYP